MLTFRHFITFAFEKPLFPETAVSKNNIKKKRIIIEI